MAIAQVNGTSATTAGVAGTTQSLSYSPTAGNFVFVVLSFGSVPTNLTVADNNSHALTGPVTISTKSFYFYGTAVTGATSYVANWTGSSVSSMSIEEYSGVSTTGATNTAGATSTTPSVTTVTTAANSWVIGAVGTGANNTYVTNTGNIRQQATGGVGNGNSNCLIDNSGTTSGSSVVTSATISSTTWAMASLELIASVTAGTTNSLSVIGGGVI